jgi:hypothetical protein
MVFINLHFGRVRRGGRCWLTTQPATSLSCLQHDHRPLPACCPSTTCGCLTNTPAGSVSNAKHRVQQNGKCKRTIMPSTARAVVFTVRLRAMPTVQRRPAPALPLLRQLDTNRHTQGRGIRRDDRSMRGHEAPRLAGGQPRAAAVPEVQVLRIGARQRRGEPLSGLENRGTWHRH